MLAALLPSLAIAIGGILSIGQVLLTLIVLSSDGGLRKALAYYAGMLTSLLAVGHGVLLLGHRAAQSTPDDGPGASAWISLVLGTLMWTFAIRTWRKPKVEDPGPPKLLASLDRASARKLLGIGLLVGLINMKNMALYLSAVQVIADAELPLPESSLLVVVMTVFFLLCILGPILLYAVGRQRAEPLLRKLRDTLERNNRPLTMTVLTIFGAGFLARAAYLFFVAS